MGESSLFCFGNPEIEAACHEYSWGNWLERCLITICCYLFGVQVHRAPWLVCLSSGAVHLRPRCKDII